MVSALVSRESNANFLPNAPKANQTAGTWIIASNTQPSPYL